MSTRDAEMKPGKGNPVNINVAISRDIHMEHSGNRDPYIAGPTDDVTLRILPGDVILGKVATPGIGGSELYGMEDQYPEGFGVLNGIGSSHSTKEDVMRDLYFVGISAGTVQPNANGATADTVAATVQGKVPVYNKFTEYVAPGDNLVYDIPAGTKDAESMFDTIPKVGAIQKGRHTAFLRPWNRKRGIEAANEDLAMYLRGSGLYMAATKDLSDAIRRIVAIGMTLQYLNSEGRDIGRNPSLAATNIRNALATSNAGGDAEALLRANLKSLHSGEWDRFLSAMFKPREHESVVNTESIPTSAPIGYRQMRRLQEDGLADLLNAASLVEDESGRRHMVGDALIGAKPGDQYSIVFKR